MCRCVRIREEYSEDPAARRVRRVLECLGPDPVPVMIAIPPEDAVFQVAAYVKGKRAIDMARVYGERKQAVWATLGWGLAQRVRRVFECLRPDPVPVIIAIPPEDAVFQVAAYVKGKRAIDMTRVYEKSKQNLEDNTGLGGTLFERRVETKR